MGIQKRGWGKKGPEGLKILNTEKLGVGGGKVSFP